MRSQTQFQMRYSIQAGARMPAVALRANLRALRFVGITLGVLFLAIGLSLVPHMFWLGLMLLCSSYGLRHILEHCAFDF
jgi:Zn-dependent membrane protease YugP